MFTLLCLDSDFHTRSSTRPLTNMTCVNSNHHQTKVPLLCPLEHTEIRQPRKAAVNPLTGIVITPKTVPQFIIPRKRPTRLYGVSSTDSAMDSTSENDYTPSCLLAQSLSHLQVKTTPYGFSFLSESPSTGRKESIYRRKSNRDSGEQNLTVKQSDCLTSSDSLYESTCPSSNSISPSCSPQSSKHNLIKVPSSLSDGHLRLGTMLDSAEIPLRRLTSTPSPPHERRTSIGNSNRRYSMPALGNTRSRSIRAEQPEKLHLHCMRRRSILRDLGEVHMQLSYFRESECLEVEVIRVENLGGSAHVGPINPILKLSLSPEKNHPKYKTTYMKGARDRQYNQTFVFNNLKPLQLLHLDLKIKVLSKKSNLRRAEHIGNIVQPLGFLCNEHCQIIKANVKPPHAPETVTPTLTVSLCLKQTKLMLTIIKAEGLTKCAIAGSPDSYVNIEVTESIGEELKEHKYQTNVRKGSVNPVFKEAFSVPIAKTTNGNDLTILLVVRNHDRILHDANIGHVRLGVGMTTTAHVDSWKKVFKKIGQSVTMKCDLCTMPIDD